MERSLTARLDHVAVAVPDPDAAEARWVGELGGGPLSHGDDGTFSSRQLRFGGGGKLELLSPSPHSGGGGFVAGFLARFGAAIHHVTLKVPDLHDALDTVRAGGLDVVDVSDHEPLWQEGFLRPSQIGGLIVQIAASTSTDEEWAARVGHQPVPPREDAAVLRGPTIQHPDLDRAAGLWTLLGARIAVEDGALRCRWPDSPLDVHIVEGSPAGPTVLRFEGAGTIPADDVHGPEVVAEP